MRRWITIRSIDADDAVQYRALHTGALIGLVLGLASVFMVITAASSFEVLPAGDANSGAGDFHLDAVAGANIAREQRASTQAGRWRLSGLIVVARVSRGRRELRRVRVRHGSA